MLPALFALTALVGGAANAYMGRQQSKYNVSMLNSQAAAAAQQASILQQVAGMQIAATMQIAQYNAQAILQSTALNTQLLNLQRQNMLAATNNQITILRDNAKLAEENATLSREQSIYDGEKIRQLNRRLVGAQKAAVAKSGIQIEGSPTDVIYDSSLQGELDALLTEYKGEIDASKSMHQSRAFLLEAQFTRENAIRTAGEYHVQAGINEAEGQARANGLLFEAQLNSQVTRANANASAYELSQRANNARLQADFVRKQRPWQLFTDVTTTAATAASVYYSPSFRS